MQRALSTSHPPPDLLQAIRNNDLQVLGELYTVNFDAVARYVQKNNGSEEDAKDIYQEITFCNWNDQSITCLRQQAVPLSFYSEQK